MARQPIVNAANEGLWAGGGVCGAIFRAAGHAELQDACDKIGHCDTGSAVITPGFRLKAKYIVHAVGPVWNGGANGEPKLLYGAYYRSLELYGGQSHRRALEGCLGNTDSIGCFKKDERGYEEARHQLCRAGNYIFLPAVGRDRE